MLLVGYTETEWIVKNQWGEDWGIDGYIYITRNAKYNCGIGLEINTLDYRLKAVSTESARGGSNGESQTANSQIANGQEKNKKWLKIDKFTLFLLFLFILIKIK